MVKPLNPEWEHFSSKYSVDGAKIQRVNCNACQKQVSASANRLQSHLRACPARPQPAQTTSGAATTATPPQQAPAAATLDHQQQHRQVDESFADISGDDLAVGTAQSDGDDVADGAEAGGAQQRSGTVGSSNNIATETVASVSMPVRTELSHARVATDMSIRAPASKHYKRSPLPKERRKDLNGSAAGPSRPLPVVTTPSYPTPRPTVTSPTAYKLQRLAIDEKRLALKVKQDARDERREALQLEILASQARQERLAAEKAAFECKVLLALSRKRLRDEGVSEPEIERILPVANT